MKITNNSFPLTKTTMQTQISHKIKSNTIPASQIDKEM